MRNVLGKIAKANGDMVAAAIRTIFAHPTAEDVHAQFDRIVDTLAGQFPDVAARDDLLQFAAFPFEHWRKIWSTDELNTARYLERARTTRREIPPTFPHAGSGTGRSPSFPPRPVTTSGHTWTRRREDGGARSSRSAQGAHGNRLLRCGALGGIRTPNLRSVVRCSIR
jgi:hypothetical protein